MRKTFVAIATAMVASLGMSGIASAQDPTDGAYASGVSDVQGFITGTAAGPLFLLAAVVVGITVGLRWLKRSKSAAT